MSNTLGKPDTLNTRQRLFVAEYLKDPARNATAAYKRAGYAATGNAAEVSACQLLRVPKVKAEIDRFEAELLAKAQEEAGLTLERLVRQVSRGAFFDVRKLLDSDGEPLPLHELDDDTAAAIAGLEIATEFDGRGEKQTKTIVRKYKLADRRGYVDMGLKVVGGYKKDNEQPGAATASALADLVSQMRGSALQVVKLPPPEDDE